MADTIATGTDRIDDLLTLAAKRDARMQEMLAIAAKNRDAAILLGNLSDREYQVFWLLLGDHSASELAGHLRISPKTLDTYKTAILRKLQLGNRIALVRWAIRGGLIQP